MMQSLTYILGAGASYQSIPVVNTFADRFGEFVRAIGQYLNSSDLNSLSEIQIKETYKLSNELLKEFQTHQSFDTYFKKLFHQGQFSSIKLNKKILHLYFIWEHLSNPINTRHADTPFEFQKQSRIDKRYDALIAGLLKPLYEKTLFTKTNFITWNYDLNLLASIKNYFYPETPFKKYLSEIEQVDGQFLINNQISILNINGYFYSTFFDSFGDISAINPFQIISNKVRANYFSDAFNDADAELIRFAWELSDKDFLHRAEIAKQYIDQSKNIVIIGYTFPLYNRLVDIKYMKGYDYTKKMVIQDPNSHELREDFITNFKVFSNLESIVAKPGCNSFYVPQDIFV